MRFVKFATPEEAEEYRAKLQRHHDETHFLRPENPRIIDVPCRTPDGQYALTLQNEDVTVEEAKALPEITFEGKLMPRPTVPIVQKWVIVARLEVATEIEVDPIQDVPVDEPPIGPEKP